MTRATTMRAAAVFAAFLLVTLLVMTASRAVFFDTTDNPGNNWAAGTVVLTDDDPNTNSTSDINNTADAMFDAGNLKPGDSLVNCINVIYQGTLDANVRLDSVTLQDGGLADDLDVVVELGDSANGFNDCTGFANPSTIYSGTLAAMGASLPAGTWSATGGAPDDIMSYRFTVTLNAATPNTEQGNDAQATFTWYAENT